MALDEPKNIEEEAQTMAANTKKRDEAPGYYKRPRFIRNMIPFDTADLSVNVIRERFLVPDQVQEKSPAEKAGLKLGDSIVKIQDKDATNMGLAEAEKEIKEAGENLQLSVTKFDEEESEGKPKEVHEINFGGNENENKSNSTETEVTNNETKTPDAPLKEKPKSWMDAQKRIPGRENWIQPPERQVWHPIVWQQPPPLVDPAMFGKEGPHKRIVSNIRRFLEETEDDPLERQKYIERMMLALPTASKDPRMAAKEAKRQEVEYEDSD